MSFSSEDADSSRQIQAAVKKEKRDFIFETSVI